MDCGRSRVLKKCDLTLFTHDLVGKPASTFPGHALLGEPPAVGGAPAIHIEIAGHRTGLHLVGGGVDHCGEKEE